MSLAAPRELATGERISQGETRLSNANKFRVQKQTSRYFPQLYSIFVPFTVSMLIIHVLILAVMGFVPTFVVSGFLTRPRSYNLDYTVLYFWIGGFVTVLTLLIGTLVLKPWREFGRASAGKYQFSHIGSSVAKTRLFAIFCIVLSLAMMGGVAIVNVFLWLSVYNSEAPPFSDPDPAFSYTYDNLALIMSWIVGLAELIQFAVYVYAVVRPLAKTVQTIGNSKSSYYIRVETATGAGGSPIIALFGNDADVAKFDRPTITASDGTGEPVSTSTTNAGYPHQHQQQQQQQVAYSGNTGAQMIIKRNTVGAAAPTTSYAAPSKSHGGGFTFNIGSATSGVMPSNV